VLDTCTELRFPQKARDGGPVLSQLFSEHLEGDHPMLGMVCTVDGGGTSLPDHVLYAVPGKRGTDERIA